MVRRASRHLTFFAPLPAASDTARLWYTRTARRSRTAPARSSPWIGTRMTEGAATTVPGTGNESATEPAGTASPEFVAKSDTTKSPIEANELLRADAGDVRATTVSMDRSGAESVTAERVTMERSGAKTLEARSAQLVNSGVAILKSEQAVLQGGSAVLGSAPQARL